MAQVTSSFGSRLRHCREKCVPRLTQAKLGELIGGYSAAAISDWEQGKSKIDADNRHVLVALLSALVQQGGVADRGAADELLTAGNYRSLDDAECLAVFGNILQSAGLPRVGQPIGSAPKVEMAPVGWPLDIPDDAFYRLPGLEQDLGHWLTLLSGSKSAPVLVIDGLGGVGSSHQPG